MDRDEILSLTKTQEAAEALLAEIAAQDMQAGWSVSYQQFLNRLPQRPKDPVFLTGEGSAAVSKWQK